MDQTDRFQCAFGGRSLLAVGGVFQRRSRSDLNAQLAYFLDRKLWQGASLRHDLTYYPRLSDLNDYYLLAQFVLEQEISSKWSVNATIILDYDATPAPDTKRSTSKVLIGISTKF